ncbi:ABC transporter ATP-binding protein [Nitrospirota bacterium]
MIRFHNAGKQYGRHWAIRELDEHIAEGEIFGLLGPNGAGKTTTIRMMTGQVMPTEGSLILGGHDIMTEPLLAKGITGYVPDNSYLYERLTGREFLLFISSLHKLTKAQANERANEFLQTMGIEEAGNELIRNYSHGMRQRLLFASALIHNPKVLIIDEPFVGLDPYGVRTLTGLLKKLSSEGVCVFLATHSLHIAQELCHRVGIVYHGRLTHVMSQEEFSQERGGLEERFIELTS